MKNCRLPIADLRLPELLPELLLGLLPEFTGRRRLFFPIGNRKSKIGNAFTLIELLVVISILGIIAALTVPVLKNFGKSDANVSASRQLLDDVGRARQLAMSQRTTVYMVFVPTNFWNDSSSGWPNSWWGSLTAAQQTAVTNLCDKQLSGYTFVAHGAMGDQPGNHQWHYLEPWQNLPDGTFIALWKFDPPYVTNNVIDPFDNVVYKIAGFKRTTSLIPFPTQDSPTSTIVTNLPYVAFNYLGQLTTEQLTPEPSLQDEYIPLAQGSVLPAIDATTRALKFQSPDVSEMPPGNSTNISYNIVHIDALTGRAVLEFHKIQ